MEIEITAADLARRLGATLEGDGARLLRGVAALDQAGPEQLSWAADAWHVARLADCKAGAVLIPVKASTAAAALACLRVAHVELALCAALEFFAPPIFSPPPGIDAAARIDPSATVDRSAAIGPAVQVGPGSQIGAGSRIGQGAYIGAGVEIGRDCVIEPNVVILDRSRLGERVIVHANATIGADGFGYVQRGGRHVKIPHIGCVVIEDDVEIGANSCVDRAKVGVTRIRRGVKIDNLVQIGHNCDIGEDCVIVAQCGVSGSAVMERGVILAGQVGVGDHVRIGSGAVVLAKSAVIGNLGPGEKYSGIPARRAAEHWRAVAAMRKLPRLLASLRTQKRVEHIDGPADHSERS